MEPCNLTVFVFCINVKITGISSELTKISQKEFGVLFGPHVETTKLSDMSKRTVKKTLKDTIKHPTHGSAIPPTWPMNRSYMYVRV